MFSESRKFDDNFKTGKICEISQLNQTLWVTKFLIYHHLLLKGICHKDFAVFGQVCTKIIIYLLPLPRHKNMLL